MLELWGPLLLTLGLGMLSAWRMAVSRFPHPTDVAALWIIFYTIPLAVLATVVGDDAGLVFLHRAAADPEIETRCIQYAALAIVCMRLGTWFATKSAPRTNEILFSLAARDGGKVSLVLLVLLTQIALGIYLFGSDIFLSGYAIASTLETGNSGQALVYMAIELIGLTIAYAYLISWSTGHRAGMKTAILAFTLLLAIAAVRGKRLEVISALVSVTILLFGTRKLFRSVRGRVLIVGLLLLLQTSVGLFRLGQELGPAQMGFNLVAEGLFAGHALPGIIDKLDTHQINYEYGQRAIVGLLAIVPRFIWPAKDEILYDGDTALDGVRPLGASTILAEVVLQGGSVAVVVWFGLIGFIFERLFQSLRRFDANLSTRHLSAGTIGYLVSITIFIPHFRDGMVPAIKLAFQASVFFYTLAGVSWHLPISWRAILRRGAPVTTSALEV